MAEIKWIKKYEKKVQVIPSPPKPQTNADRIRRMSDEELAHFVTGEDFCELLCKNSPSFCNGDCEKWMLEWLRKEAEDGRT